MNKIGGTLYRAKDWNRNGESGIMTHTFDFVNEVRKCDELKKELLDNIKNHKQESMIIEHHKIEFDFINQAARIYCNDSDYSFACKIIPAEIAFTQLEKLIKDGFDSEFEFKYC